MSGETSGQRSVQHGYVGSVGSGKSNSQGSRKEKKSSECRSSDRLCAAMPSVGLHSTIESLQSDDRVSYFTEINFHCHNCTDCIYVGLPDTRHYREYFDSIFVPYANYNEDVTENIPKEFECIQHRICCVLSDVQSCLSDPSSSSDHSIGHPPPSVSASLGTAPAMPHLASSVPSASQQSHHSSSGIPTWIPRDRRHHGHRHSDDINSGGCGGTSSTHSSGVSERPSASGVCGDSSSSSASDGHCSDRRRSRNNNHKMNGGGRRMIHTVQRRFEVRRVRMCYLLSRHELGALIHIDARNETLTPDRPKKDGSAKSTHSGSKHAGYVVKSAPLNPARAAGSAASSSSSGSTAAGQCPPSSASASSAGMGTVAESNGGGSQSPSSSTNGNNNGSNNTSNTTGDRRSPNQYSNVRYYCSQYNERVHSSINMESINMFLDGLRHSFTDAVFVDDKAFQTWVCGWCNFKNKIPNEMCHDSSFLEMKDRNRRKLVIDEMEIQFDICEKCHREHCLEQTPHAYLLPHNLSMSEHNKRWHPYSTQTSAGSSAGRGGGSSNHESRGAPSSSVDRDSYHFDPYHTPRETSVAGSPRMTHARTPRDHQRDHHSASLPSVVDRPSTKHRRVSLPKFETMSHDDFIARDKAVMQQRRDKIAKRRSLAGRVVSEDPDCHHLDCKEHSDSDVDLWSKQCYYDWIDLTYLETLNNAYGTHEQKSPLDKDAAGSSSSSSSSSAMTLTEHGCHLKEFAALLDKLQCVVAEYNPSISSSGMLSRLPDESTAKTLRMIHSAMNELLDESSLPQLLSLSNHRSSSQSSHSAGSSSLFFAAAAAAAAAANASHSHNSGGSGGSSSASNNAGKNYGSSYWSSRDNDREEHGLDHDCLNCKPWTFYLNMIEDVSNGQPSRYFLTDPDDDPECGSAAASSSSSTSGSSSSSSSSSTSDIVGGHTHHGLIAASSFIDELPLECALNGLCNMAALRSHRKWQCWSCDQSLPHTMKYCICYTSDHHSSDHRIGSSNFSSTSHQSSKYSNASAHHSGSGNDHSAQLKDSLMVIKELADAMHVTVEFAWSKCDGGSFLCQVWFDEECVSQGQGSTKKKAQRAGAERALKVLCDEGHKHEINLLKRFGQIMRKAPDDFTEVHSQHQQSSTSLPMDPAIIVSSDRSPTPSSASSTSSSDLHLHHHPHHQHPHHPHPHPHHTPHSLPHHSVLEVKFLKSRVSEISHLDEPSILSCLNLASRFTIGFGVRHEMVNNRVYGFPRLHAKWTARFARSLSQSAANQSIGDGSSTPRKSGDLTYHTRGASASSSAASASSTLVACSQDSAGSSSGLNLSQPPRSRRKKKARKRKTGAAIRNRMANQASVSGSSLSVTSAVAPNPSAPLSSQSGSTAVSSSSLSSSFSESVAPIAAGQGSMEESSEVKMTGHVRYRMKVISSSDDVSGTLDDFLCRNCEQSFCQSQGGFDSLFEEWRCKNCLTESRKGPNTPPSSSEDECASDLRSEHGSRMDYAIDYFARMKAISQGHSSRVSRVIGMPSSMLPPTNGDG